MREVNDEVKELSNKKNVTADPLEDKLALFRQQVYRKFLFQLSIFSLFPIYKLCAVGSIDKPQVSRRDNIVFMIFYSCITNSFLFVFYTTPLYSLLFKYILLSLLRLFFIFLYSNVQLFLENIDSSRHYGEKGYRYRCELDSHGMDNLIYLRLVKVLYKGNALDHA